MRVGIVISLLQMGGMETVLKSLATYLQGQGNVVEFIETDEKGAWSAYFKSIGFPVKTVSLRWYRSKLAHSIKVATLLKDYDIIFLNDVPFAQAGLGLLPINVIAIPIIHLDMPSFIANAAGNYGQWDKVVAVSPALKERFVKNTGYSTSAIEFIPNGVSFPTLAPKKINTDRPVNIVYMGRVENKQKGICLLPDIFRAVIQSGVNIHVSIVGDGPDLIELRRLFKEKEVENVKFYGSLEHQEALAIMEANDVLIMPSLFEGMPIALLEAMARGLVPVVSDLQGSTDMIVRNGINGFLISVGSVDGFVDAICRLAGDRQKLSEMSIEASATIKEKYSSDAMGKAYLNLIDQIISERKISTAHSRSLSVDSSLLGDLPKIPVFLIRPVRKILKLLGVWA